MPPGLLLVLIPILLLAGTRVVSGWIIDYAWWKELGQVQTWFSMIGYGFVPVFGAGLLAAALLWTALARGLKQAGRPLSRMRLLSRLSGFLALAAGFVLANATIDSWTVVRWFGSRGMGAGEWRDPLFQEPLAFYLFNLPFYRLVYAYVLTLMGTTAVVYWVAARVWQAADAFVQSEHGYEFDIKSLRLSGALESLFLRGAVVVFLLALAVKAYLDRYGMLLDDHGFMVGVNYVDEHIRLPLQWLYMAACAAAAALVAAGQWRSLALIPGVAVVQVVVPWAVSALYVRPNEMNLERPYIVRHIAATRSAFGLDRRSREGEFPARLDTRIDLSGHKVLLDNVRLWDWRAFHDTVQQIQALRPYYVFADSDVDRYMIDGQLRQVLLTPRELDIRQLPDARKSWINPHFVYTHGYGMVMAEANRITPEGLPHLFVQDAPAQVRTPSLKLTRPEIYYGETTHEPVFVRTGQKEFSYPSGNDTVFTRYEGTGGFPIASFGMRLAAAIRDVDFNILLTNLFTPDSRMMIQRNVIRRLEAMTGFLRWDNDPYLVVTDDGKLIWTVDGYTFSESHPYAHRIQFGGERINYLRNPVKATVDAYNGTVSLYVFDESDPILEAYRKLFPNLFQPASAMPESLRKHVRYPEAFFRAQAEIYRIYHMRDPQTFYNKEDLWDVARNIYGRENKPQLVQPTYVVATLPGEQQPEFLLLLPFTPRGKDNLIGLMIARCDGDTLGELHFLQLSKQALIFGPMQIEARIDQDPDISKDLTLWNQKGSEVLRGQMLVLPVGLTFLYVEPIYIQAAEARMPQLKKVVVAAGNDLIYRNTYDEAIAALAGLRPAEAVATAAKGTTSAPAPVPSADDAGRRLEEIRRRFQRYRDLWSQGKYAEAGGELQAIENLVKK